MPISRRSLLSAAPALGLAAGSGALAAPPVAKPGAPPTALVPPDPKVTTPPPAAAAAAVSAAPKPTAPASDHETVRLWPGDPPGTPPALPDARLRRTGGRALRDVKLSGVQQPVMFVYRPARPNGVGLLVMPGGGYSSLSLQNEGSNVARVFADKGWTVFVLSYRLPGEGWTNRADAPLQDAIRAMRLVRAGAKGFGVDPARVGILGFSAGGHLAASLAVNAGEPLYAPVDAADALPARPTFAGLAYPVTTLEPPCARTASHRNLLGPDPSPALVARRSPVLHVARDTPPNFLLHALDDPIVDPACGIAWLQACRAAGVAVEAQFLERGGHGFGVKLPEANPGAVWPDQFRLWAARHGA